MNRRQFLILSLAATSVVLLPGCFQSKAASTLEGFFRNLEKGELDKAMEAVDPQMIETFGSSKVRMILAEAANEIEAKGGIESFKVEDESINGDLANITATVEYGDGTVETETIQMIRSEGKWYLDASK